MTQSYTTVTELPGRGATSEQLAMLYTRYHLAADLSEGKDVVEVACGAGVGLGYLARRARTVVGGDYDEDILRYARTHYRDGVWLLRLDAHALPFASRAFDVVVLFEALYYLSAPERFFDEARRVLRSGGTVLICTVNKDFPGFNPSPLSYRYFSGSELHALLSSAGFDTQLYGCFPVKVSTFRDRVFLAARRTAVSLHLIPPTMRGKELLKRIVYGELTPIPNEVMNGMAELHTLVPLSVDVPMAFKVLYAIGHLR